MEKISCKKINRFITASFSFVDLNNGLKSVKIGSATRNLSGSILNKSNMTDKVFSQNLFNFPSRTHKK